MIPEQFLRILACINVHLHHRKILFSPAMHPVFFFADEHLYLIRRAASRVKLTVSSFASTAV